MKEPTSDISNILEVWPNSTSDFVLLLMLKQMPLLILCDVTKGLDPSYTPPTRCLLNLMISNSCGTSIGLTPHPKQCERNEGLLAMNEVSHF